MARDRQSLTEAKSKTERLAPTLFDKDREGAHLAKAKILRGLTTTTRTAVARDATAQKQQIDDWIKDDTVLDVTSENDRSILQGYCELTRDEFEYIKELVRVYNTARCYFVREVVSQSFVNLIVSARLEAISTKTTYEWDDVVATILGQLVNVGIHAKLFNFTHDQRADGSSARLWVASKIKQQAQLEASGQVQLGNEIYVGYLVAQISDEEQRKPR